MQGTIDVDFEVTFQTNKDNIDTFKTNQELEVETYLDRVEECHGYHQMWEVTDSEIERAIDDFIDNYDEELLLELAGDEMEEYPEDELAVKIIKVEAV